MSEKIKEKSEKLRYAAAGGMIGKRRGEGTPPYETPADRLFVGAALAAARTINAPGTVTLRRGGVLPRPSGVR